MSDIRLPSFLIIGAMKAGTTSLYRDLLDSGDVCFAPDKETNWLASDDVLTQPGRLHYSALYGRAKSTDICGDASTSYTKQPAVTAVPQRAQLVLGDSIKIIYMVRHPVDRIKSHHNFLKIRNLADPDINVAVRANPDYVNFSKYWMQISSWLEIFSDKQIMIVELERYARERADVLREVRAFLGLDEMSTRVISNTVYNKTAGQPVVAGAWKWLSDHPLYRNHVRPHLGVEFRRRFQLFLLPTSNSGPSSLHDDTLSHLNGALEEDVAIFRSRFGVGANWAGFSEGRSRAAE